MKKVLVCAVHPDDETLGCGGTLLKYKNIGKELNWLIATDMKKDDGFTKKQIAGREKEIKTVSKRYGFKNVYRLGLSPNKVKSHPFDRLVKDVSDVLKKVKPDTIYLSFKGDIHSDHRAFFEAIYSCTKTFRYPFLKDVFMMETISETEFAPSLDEYAFIPNFFVDITKFLKKKIEIAKIYKTEMKKHPFPRSAKNIEALATFRGAMAGCKYAESFMLLKKIC